MSEKEFKIAICGAGIGGLSLAAVISKHAPDVAVDIYEAKEEISTIGAGIAIWKRSWQILKDLGLDDEVKKRNIPPPMDGEVQGPIFRKADQPHAIDFHNHMMPYGATTVHRPALIDMLQGMLSQNCKIYTSKRLVDYNDLGSRGVDLKFSDGTEAHASVLIGSDGVHSAVRAAMYQTLADSSRSEEESAALRDCAQEFWTGTYAYRGYVPLGNLLERFPFHLAAPRIWCGQDKHVVTIPWPAMGRIGIACFCTERSAEGTKYEGQRVTPATTEEVLKYFEGWESELLAILEGAQDLSRWAIHVVKPLPYSTIGRVALLGDALKAHGMTPHQGVGGGQAIEDAHLLGRLLAYKRARTSDLTQVLEIYQKIRLPQAQSAWEKSRTNGLVYEFIHPDFQHIHHNATAEDLRELGEFIAQSFSWLVEGGADKDWNIAETMVSQIE